MHAGHGSGGRAPPRRSDGRGTFVRHHSQDGGAGMRI